jgi:hypothetical protein
MRLLHSSSAAAWLAALAMSCASCAADQTDTPPNDTPPAKAAATGCLAAGDGELHAPLRGAIVADIHWANAIMQCEGGPRPDGHGIRISIAGPVPPGVSTPDAKLLRFIFGIELTDSAAGAVESMPTNLTLIVEGAQGIFSTRGDEKCAVEKLQRTPLLTSSGTADRVQVRGYCTAPAENMTGDARVLVPTFDFVAYIKTGDAP